MNRFFLMAGLFVSLSLTASGSGLDPSTPLFMAVDKLWGDGDWFFRINLDDIQKNNHSSDLNRESLKLKIIEDDQKNLIDRVNFMDQATRTGFANVERTFANFAGGQRFFHSRASDLEARVNGLECEMLQSKKAQVEQGQVVEIMRQELQRSRLESRQNKAKLAAVEGTMAALNRLIISEIVRLEKKIADIQKSGMRAQINLHPRARTTRTSTGRTKKK